MLKFIGTGSAFNTELGNNGAFIKNEQGDIMVMIDCGSATFERLNKFKVLDCVDIIYVIMTHFHPDHVGSLGDLIFYKYFNTMPFESRVNIMTTQPLELVQLLTRVGVRDNMYRVIKLTPDKPNWHVLGGFGKLDLLPIEVPHDKTLTCHAYVMKIEGNPRSIYYSGDARAIPEHVLGSFLTGEISTMYHDVSTADYPDNVHLSMKQLCELIPTSERHRVWCMHLDKSCIREEYEALGFNVVESIEVQK